MTTVTKTFRTSKGIRVVKGTQVEVIRYMNGVNVNLAKITGEGFDFITTLGLVKKLTDYNNK